MYRILTRTKAAVARLRAYTPPPFPLWDRLPLSRRAAVLILLYADRQGDLRVVITMRAASLRSFSGRRKNGPRSGEVSNRVWQATLRFPAGRRTRSTRLRVNHTDLPNKHALTGLPLDQIARREAWEEIGLPMDDSKLPSPFRIEQLCCLPYNLARTDLVVRPCVALLHTSADPGAPSAGESLMPRLDAKEVAAVFSAPFHNFLKASDEVLPGQESEKLPQGDWYEGSWTRWHESFWRVHYFYVPLHNQRVTKPTARDDGLAGIAENLAAEEPVGRYKVWGMTARILVEAATVAYGETPEFEHNAHFGDEDIIERLAEMGQLGEKKKPGSESTHEDESKEASKM